MMAPHGNSRARDRSHGRPSTSQSYGASPSASQSTSGSYNRSHGPTSTSQSSSDPQSYHISGDLDWVLEQARALSGPGSAHVNLTLTYPDDRKRSRRGDDDDGDGERRPRSRRRREKSPERPIGDNCGNCGKAGHKAHDCVKVGRSGWMDAACPKCNSTRHFYDNCQLRVKAEDLDYLFWYRQNKGPVKSGINVGRLLRSVLMEGCNPRYRLDDKLPPPYSPKFARQIQRDQPWDNWEYQHLGHPEREARSRKYEPQFYDQTLGQLAQALDHPGWRQELENVDPSHDGETPTLRLPRTMSVRARIRAAGPRALPKPVVCHNCRATGHETESCTAVCGLCGSSEHNVLSCNRREQACGCELVPRHLRKDCTQPCIYCPLINNGPAHTCTDCQVLCHYCLDRDHNMRHCPTFLGKDGVPLGGRTCQYCKDDFHLAGHCLKKMCPVFGCKDPLACQDHCLNCGWEITLLNILEINGKSGHICQWRKEWDVQPHGRRVILVCNYNPSHPRMNAEDLQHIRGQSADAELSNGSEPCVECPGCKGINEEMDVDE
ncbi:hypothetical protein F5Y06DRAFT_186883 [Hypoxylon sp. FL0890]|nr:hypothetical protein F5Y06DRAFT_186883 [Hypoxylon sp. FL0890]